MLTVNQRKPILDLAQENGFQNKPVESSGNYHKPDVTLDRCLFLLWELADFALMRLEDIRDRNTPTTPDEEWNDEFCSAIEMIPEARRLARECWLDYYCRKENGQ